MYQKKLFAVCLTSLLCLLMLTPAQAGKDYRKGEGRISPSALVKMKARAYAIPLDKPDPHASRSFD
ncbi:MAG: hypothetical protein JSW34_01780, partial [Candidatus Zixiibacteriota bacterium]